MRRAAAAAALGLVVAVAVLAVVDPFEPADGGGSAPDTAAAARPDGDELSGPDLPNPGALSGRLIFTTADGCRPAILDLEALRVGPLGPETGCGLATSPDGTKAIARGPRQPGGAAAIMVLDLLGRPAIEDEIGTARGRVDWSPDGSRVAWCDEARDTRVLDVESSDVVTLAGCDPRFGDGRGVFTRQAGLFDVVLLRDGLPLLAQNEIEAALPQANEELLDIIGYDATPDGTIALLVLIKGEEELAQILQVWRGDELVRSLEVASTPREFVSVVGDFGLGGRTVRLSPDGREVAVGSLRDGSRVVLFQLGTERRVLLPAQHGYDWSPDGLWLAVATDGEVLILGAERSDHVFRLPVAARSLSWRE